jgi:peptide chain release factor 3
MQATLPEYQRRRTFAIISHPDAGKTTLTEKFLLYGGAINLAGAVKARKKDTETASDWMELEKKRGISVSSTVMQFDYGDFRINLLDTPGHRDFSEDTYRVLTAVDAAVMVLDVAKGIEEQTLKLFEVCRQRGIPIFTFINKCDRPGKDAFSLLDEIEQTLGLKTFPVNWPVGLGPDFCGVFDRIDQKLHRYGKVSGGRFKATVEVSGLDDPELAVALRPDQLEPLREDLELLDMAGTSFDRDAVLAGAMTPVYFGSAINNFGVQLLLDGFLRYAPAPGPRKAGEETIHPASEPFSAFVFKIQANMDPKHRDRLIFLRICSGRFSRDLQVQHVQSGRKIRLSFSHQIFGRERETQDEAWPGDIIGITGQASIGIGDTLSEEASICYPPIPRFPPECFILLHNTDTGQFKKFRTGLDQLLQEKVVQRFFPLDSVSNIPLLGAVGSLQFDVVCHRMESEYGAETRIEATPWKVTRWLDSDVDAATLQGRYLSGCMPVRDADGRLAMLFDSEWNMGYFARENPSLRLHTCPDARTLAAV